MIVRAARGVEQELDLGETAVELAHLDPRVNVLKHAVGLDDRRSKKSDQDDRNEGDRRGSAERGMPPGELAHPFPEARLSSVLHRKVVEKPVQVFGEVPGPGISIASVKRQALGNEGVETPRNPGTLARAAREPGDGRQS